MTLREEIEVILKRDIVPALRSRGFKGSMPHFRRMGPMQIDLLTFQFDRYGGGFVIEISKCAPTGVITPWGQPIAPSKVTAYDLHPAERLRLKPKEGSGTDAWFRYDDGKFDACVAQVIKVFPQADEYWFRKQ